MPRSVERPSPCPASARNTHLPPSSAPVLSEFRSFVSASLHQQPPCAADTAIDVRVVRSGLVRVYSVAAPCRTAAAQF